MGEAFVRAFAADGQPLGHDIPLRTPPSGNHDAPAVAATADGGFVVAWQAHGDVPGIAGNGITARRFNAAAQPVGPEFRVNSDAAGDQVLPAVAGLADNGFVVAWQSKKTEPDSATYARVYDA